MSIPYLTHLQSLVLWIIAAKTISGARVRRCLKCNGIEMSGPAFYQLMARLEENALVDGEYQQKIVEGQIIRERFYRSTPLGVSELEATKGFYGKLSVEEAA